LNWADQTSDMSHVSVHTVFNNIRRETVRSRDAASVLDETMRRMECYRARAN
jgi:hypothetical protein